MHLMLRLTRRVAERWAALRWYSTEAPSAAAVYGWGCCRSGQLGQRASGMETTPVEVIGATHKVRRAVCGDSFTVLSRLGSNMLRLLGQDVTSRCDGTKHDSCTDDSQSASHEFPMTSEVLQIACGRHHIMVLTDAGVFAAGANSAGQCGIGVHQRMVEQFTAVPLEAGQCIEQIVCGLDHTLLLSEDTRVLSCGWGADGQTGQGHYSDSILVTEVEGDLRGVRAKQVSSTVDSCLAVSEAGQVFAWGNNEYSQLGLETTEEQVCQPRHSTILQNLGPVAQIGSGGSFSVALTAAGEVYVWGYGVLGLGPDVTSTKTPRRLDSLLDSGHTVIQLMCGTDHIAVLTDSGNLMVWGRGSYGRLGLGETCDQWTPKQVRLPGCVTEMSCRTSHMLALVEPR